MTVTDPVCGMPIDSDEAAATLEPVSTKTASGKVVKGFVAKPAKTAPAVLLIHEWWGLNNQIKAVAADLSEQGYMAFCVDLYDGHVTADATQAGAWMEQLDPKQATETLVAWVQWLKKAPGCSGKVATLGWCMGGGWSLNASIADPVDATVVYYGRVDRSVTDLGKLKGPVLGQFAARDQWINKPMVEGFEAAMKKAGKKLEVYWYDADHAFANPSNPKYKKDDAAKAHAQALTYLRERFKLKA